MTIEQVIKSTGETEAFQEEKFRVGLERAGADPALIDQTVRYVQDTLPPQTSTDQVFACSLRRLKDLDRRVAARYSLARAIANFGPAGYHFERFIGAILTEHGYQTQVGTIIQGQCVEHEVDVLAEKDNRRILIECKFHHHPGTRSDLKVAMYTAARFEDIVANSRRETNGEPTIHEVWLVTNTKCTTQATKYARCKNLHILGWRYPHNQGLEQLIESKGLYPVSVLPSLTRAQLTVLSDHQVMLARELCQRGPDDMVATFGFTPSQAQTLYDEAKLLC